jgi:hypothetical protein
LIVSAVFTPVANYYWLTFNQDPGFVRCAKLVMAAVLGVSALVLLIFPRYESAEGRIRAVRPQVTDCPDEKED